MYMQIKMIKQIISIPCDFKGGYLAVEGYGLYKTVEQDAREEPGKDWSKTRLACSISRLKLCGEKEGIDSSHLR